MAQSHAVNSRSDPFTKSRKKFSHFISFNPIQDFGGKKLPPYELFHVTSTNVGISVQNFPTFNFNPFATVM